MGGLCETLQPSTECVAARDSGLRQWCWACVPAAGQHVCRLTVPGYPKQTEGCSSKKADAQEEAARQFVLWLKQTGEWNQAQMAAVSLPTRAPVRTL